MAVCVGVMDTCGSLCWVDGYVRMCVGVMDMCGCVYWGDGYVWMSVLG